MTIRVLHVVGKMTRGGQETHLMDIYRHIDREKVQFDFIVHTPEKGEYDDEVRALGGKIFVVEKINQGIIRYIRSIRKIVKDNHYQIVTCHTAHAAGFIVLLAAKQGGAPVRIAHSHNTSFGQPFLHKICIPLLNHFATDRFAVSVPAGIYMFGSKKPFTVINNAVDPAAFSFDKEKREKIRARFGFQNQLVLGHVGRMTKQKNHSFLLDIFAAVHEKDPDARLLLIGIGELESEIREKAEHLGLINHISFLGSRPDVADLMQAMDVFVLPSIYEGLGRVAIEAQASGLPCVLADTIPPEARIVSEITVLSLRDTPQKWAEAIFSCRGKERKSGAEEIRRAGFDIVKETEELQNFYLQKVNS